MDAEPARYDLIVRGGTVISASDTFIADLAVSNGRVKAVGAFDGSGRVEIDARGKVIFPGAVAATGLVCMKNPSDKPLTSVERSAISGGVTTLLKNSLPESCSVDYALLLRSDRRPPSPPDLVRALKSAPGWLDCFIDSVLPLWDAVQKGRLTENRFVDLVATAPAKAYGLYPRKGHLNPGADADIVVLDPNKVHSPTHHNPILKSSFKAVKGSIIHVYSRGSPIISDTEWLGVPHHGQRIKRAQKLLI